MTKTSYPERSVRPLSPPLARSRGRRGLLRRGCAVTYLWSAAEMAAPLLGAAALTLLIPRKEG